MTFDDVTGIVIAVLLGCLPGLRANPAWRRVDGRGELGTDRGGVRAAGHQHSGVGGYLAKVYRNEKAPGDRLFLPVERLVYRLLRIDPHGEQRWIAFVGSAVALTVVGVLLNYLSFAYNTCCRAIRSPRWGESATGVQHRGQLRDQYQLAKLQRRIHDEPVQSDVRAGGAPVFVRGHRMALAAAFIRGVIRTGQRHWGTSGRHGAVHGRVLVPLSFVFAIVLLAAGVIDNFTRHKSCRQSRR